KYRLGAFSYGVHVIDTRTGKTRNVFIPYQRKQYEYKFNNIMAVAGDKDGSMYVLSRSGFYHFDKNYELVSRFDYYKDEDVPLQHFFFGRYLYDLDENRLLIVSINGLYIYDKAKRAIKMMESGDCPILAQYMNYPGPAYTPYQFFQIKPGVFFIT